MKLNFTFFSLMLLAFTTTNLFAQDKEAKSYKKVRIGLGLEAGLPMGAMDYYKYAGGATLRVAVALNEKSAVTATSGAIAFIPEPIPNVDMKASINIPIKAGYKYMLTDRIYGLGEAGTTISKTYAVAPNGQMISASGSSFTYAAGIGAHALRLDTSLRYEGYSNGGFLGLRVGFNF